MGGIGDQAGGGGSPASEVICACGSVIEVDVDLQIREVDCPSCGKSVPVPSDSGQVTAPIVRGFTPVRTRYRRQASPPPAHEARTGLAVTSIVIGAGYSLLTWGAILMLLLAGGRRGGFRFPSGSGRGDGQTTMLMMSSLFGILSLLLLIGGILLVTRKRSGLTLITVASVVSVGIRLMDLFVAFYTRMPMDTPHAKGVIFGAVVSMCVQGVIVGMVLLWGGRIRRDLEVLEEQEEAEQGGLT